MSPTTLGRPAAPAAVATAGIFSVRPPRLRVSVVAFLRRLRPLRGRLNHQCSIHPSRSSSDRLASASASAAARGPAAAGTRLRRCRGTRPRHLLAVVADLRVDEEMLFPQAPQAVHGMWDTRIVPCPSQPFIRLRASGSPRRSASRPRRSAAAGRRSASGRHTLIAAPTGSGKTLAAFLTALDDLSAGGLARAAARRGPRRLRLAAQGAERRHPQEPRGAAARHPRGCAEALGSSAPRDHRRGAHRRHAAGRARGDAADAAAHPGHDARVAVPAADRGAQPRDAADRRAR